MINMNQSLDNGQTWPGARFGGNKVTGAPRSFDLGPNGVMYFITATGGICGDTTDIKANRGGPNPTMIADPPVNDDEVDIEDDVGCHAPSIYRDADSLLYVVYINNGYGDSPLTLRVKRSVDDGQSWTTRGTHNIPL